LLLDAGDALTAEGSPEGQVAPEGILAGMNLMGYNAMAIGPLELELGESTLRRGLDEAEFPVLSANAFWSGNRGLVGEPFTVLQVGSYRFGVIGLTRIPEDELADFVVVDPMEVLAELVPEVTEQADAVILLTNLSYRSAAELAQKVPGIDLVVAALPMQLPERVVRTPETGSLIVVAEQPLPRHSGRRVGRLTVVIDNAGTLEDKGWESIAMGPELADDPEMRELLDEYR
jgi:2',3'-cyclic-nucleotide 2'-phosphodiesterase (5'-nucleotidase family)